MATYYFTIADEEPAVYHDDEDCPEGKKIEKRNRVDSVMQPAGRRRCEVCGTLAGPASAGS